MPKSRPIRILLALAAGALGMVWSVQGASADAVDHVRFKVDGTVIVWGEHRDTVLDAMPARIAPAAGPVMPVLFGNGTLAAPTLARAATAPLDAGPTVRARFHVASNTGFRIEAELTGAAPGASLADLPFFFALDPAAVGTSAQIPHRGGASAGLTGEATTLDDLRAPRTLYRADRRTAALTGSIADQSVGFEGRWQAPDNGARMDVVFTVFAP